MFRNYHLPTTLWAIFILVICGIPGDKIPELSFWQWLRPDKIVHLLVFGIQSFLLHKSLLHSGKPLLINKAAMLAVVVSSTYGILVEVLQDWVFINRSGDVRDALANTIGAILGVWLIVRKSKNRSA